MTSEPLTRREREIVNLMSAGSTNLGMANSLGISVATIETNGLFTICVRGDGPYEVTVANSVHPFAPCLLVEDNVIPGGMLQLRLPRETKSLASVVGRFADVGERARAQERIWVELRSSVRVEAKVEIEDGEFQLMDVTPGTYTLVVTSGTATIPTGASKDGLE